MKKIVVAVCSMLFLICINFQPAQAVMTPEEMQRMQTLERRVAELESVQTGRVAVEDEAVAPIIEGIEIGGGISTNYTYNFNDPDSRTNALRVFDSKANSFDVENVELNVQKNSEELGIGGRVDLTFIETADVITPFGTTDDDFDVQQAYIYYIAPVGSGLTLKAGKFVTPIGAEVIEPWDNWNFSRGFLFGFAIPFTHVGITGSYTFTDMISGTIGVANGWDNVDDNNDGKSVLGNLTLGPWNWVTFAINGIVGPEQTDENDNIRGVIDLILTVKPEPIPQLTLMANYDYGSEENVPVFGADPVTGDPIIVGAGDATWQGIAGYAKYDFNDRTYAALRLEWFDDEDGARTGTAQELVEVTLTGAYMVAEGLWVRLEYRHDDSDASPFQDGSTAEDSQDTVSTEVLYVL
jgi:hypothetical protein